MIWIHYVDREGAERGGELLSVKGNKLRLQPKILGAHGRPTVFRHRDVRDLEARRLHRIRPVIIDVAQAVSIRFVSGGNAYPFAGVF